MSAIVRVSFSFLLVLAVARAPAAAADPLKVMRTYCRADGMGDRLQPSRWTKIAPLVSWKIEPAWDQIRLIRGYEMTTPRLLEDRVEVDVTYTVSGDLRAGKVVRGIRLETRTYQLISKDEGKHWRILGPPSVPYLFESHADVDGLAALLAPESSGYASNSSFAWHLLRRDHPDLPYRDTESLANATFLNVTEEPKPGHLVLYYDGEIPFHVGVVETDGVIVSSTMNAAIWRGPADSFPGTVRYWQVDTEITHDAAEDSAAPTSAGTPAAEQTPASVSPDVAEQ